jgi:hypothetical protein
MAKERNKENAKEEKQRADIFHQDIFAPTVLVFIQPATGYDILCDFMNE